MYTLFFFMFFFFQAEDGIRDYKVTGVQTCALPISLLDQHLHRLPDLVERCAPVDVVHLIEVDVIGLQAPEGSLACVADVARREERVIGPVAHRAVELGRDHHLLATPSTLSEPAADDLFGDALALLPAVDVGGVEEVEARVQRSVHDLVGCRFVGLGAEVHGAEAEATDGESGTAEVCVLHPLSLTVRSIRAAPGRSGTTRSPAAAALQQCAFAIAGR